MDHGASQGALAGIDVAVVGEGVWGQLTGTYLGEYGARVLRVEHPRGDPLRHLPPAAGQWSVSARTGRSLTCDLTTDGGRRAARDLCRAVDLVIDGEGGRWSSQLVDPLDPQRPAVVEVCALDDPAAPAGPGDGLLAAAAGGLVHLTGHPDRPPVRLGSDFVEHLTAAFGCQAALGAIALRRRSGTGSTVRVTGESSVRRILEWTLVAYAATGRVRVREGNQPSAVAPLGLYPAADGVAVAVVGASDANFRRLTDVMGRPELRERPEYATTSARAQHSAAVNAEVAAWVAGLRSEEVVDRCLDGGVLVGLVRTVPELFADPQVASRSDLVDWPGADGSTAPQPAPQPHSELHATSRHPAPALGEANRELWPSLTGRSEAQLDALQAGGEI